MWADDLRYLDTLERAKSMSRAARELRVDKATVSRRIAALERDAPAPLFERRGGAIELTTYGVRALDAFRELERARARFETELEQVETSIKGRVRLTAPSFFASEIVVPALAPFLERHPDIDLQVYGTNRVLDLARGEADVALRNVRPVDRTLVARKVGRLGLATFASRSYLERRGGLCAPGDLEGHDLLVYDSGPYGGPGFEWFPEAARRGRVVFGANDSLPLREAARAGLGLAALPHFLGDEAAELERVPGAGDGAAELWVVTREELRRLARVREVVGFISDVVQKNQGRLFRPS